MPGGSATEVDPLYPGLIILTAYDCGHTFQSHLRDEPCANARLHEKPVLSEEASCARDYVSSAFQNFSVGVSLAGIEPVGFRVKSDLRNHCAIVHPRLYDCAMVTQITLGVRCAR